MKAALILAGDQPDILRQAEEIAGYLLGDDCGIEYLEVWIMAEQTVDVSTLPLDRWVDRIKLVAGCPLRLAEEYLAVLTELYRDGEPQLLIFGSDWFSTGLAVRSACRLRGTSCTGVKRAHLEGGGLVVEKSVYSSHLTAKFRLKNGPYCLAIAKGFKGNGNMAANPAPVEKISWAVPLPSEWLQSYQIRRLAMPAGLATAKIVVAVGNGVGDRDSIPLMAELAELLGGALGGSRPVVMNAWLDMDRLIGASGSILAPEVCIVIGASGAAAFAVGIEKSKLIIAVNHDAQAPIFKMADVAICSDYRGIVLELIKRLNSE